MTGPYPPQGGDPRQWAQPAPGDQPEQTQRLTSGGFPAQQPPPSGGFPAQPPSQPGGFPAQPGYQQPYQPPGGQWPGYGQGQQQQQQQQPSGYPQPTQQFGQQFNAGGQYPGFDVPGSSGTSTPSSGKKRGGRMWGILAGVVVLLAIAAVLLFAWPGWLRPTVLSQSAVQDGVKTILTNNYQLDVSAVSCPANEKVKAGNSFSCTATVDGKQESVQVTVKDDNGTYQVAQPTS